MLLKLCLDVLVLAGILQFLQDEEPNWPKLFSIALLMGVMHLVVAWTLGGVLGIFMLVPVLLIYGAVLFLFCGLPPSQVAIALGVLLAYNLAYALIMSLLLTPSVTVGTLCVTALGGN